VNRLLDLSRIEAGRLVPSREPTDLSIYTADLASAFRAAFEQAGLFLVVDCPPLTRLVSLDRDLWEKIVLNLLSNALKFTLEGGVTVTLRGDTDTATLIVSDTGIGIPEDELPKIFERFHRVRHARGRSQEGAGIGLSLSRDLVALHGGTLTASSIAGLGSAFVVKLPLGPVASRSATPPERETRGTTAFADEAMRWQAPLTSMTEEPATVTKHGVASKPSIVVVEDNADMRDYVERILSNDYALTLVADGREALLAVRRSPPDLVLSDVMMPELDGFALLAAIREDPRLAQIPVILLSARAGEASRLDGLKAGADDYLTKPFSARELTLRVATHLALGRARKDATAARDILRNVLLQAPVAVSLVTGEDFVYELANQSYEQMVGKKGLVGRKFRDVFPELVDDAPVLSMLRAVRESREPFNAAEYKVPLARGPNGELEDVYFLFTCQPVIVPFGESDSILTVAVDVTEQVALRRNLELVSAEREHLLAQERAARNDAESSSRAKDQFLAMLGHELRNPLAPITTALHLMRLGPEQAYERERAVIERQVDHLMRLVDDLLDVSRITRGTIELRKIRIELAEVIAKAVEVTSPLLEARRHHLEILVNSRGRAVFADPARMTQVVSNLLSNAAKYTDEGGHITIESRLDGEELALSVRDDGIGIDPAMLPFVFDTFVQETQSIERSHGGLGLGLAIVKNIVAMHGGRATVMSDGKGKGSIFTIHLPAIEQLDRLSPEPEVPAMPVAAVDPSYGRVLVVDDNADAAELLAELLRVVGAEVRIAHDGLSALEIAGLFSPSIGLIDIGLPLIDGYEVARRLRQAMKTPLFLVAITGYGQDQDRARSSAAGFDAHLVKPVDFSALDALLRSRRISVEVPLESAG
jgi:signal transduction histidine kinase